MDVYNFETICVHLFMYKYKKALKYINCFIFIFIEIRYNQTEIYTIKLIWNQRRNQGGEASALNTIYPRQAYQVFPIQKIFVANTQ